MSAGGSGGLFAIGGGIARGLVLAGVIQAWSATNTFKNGPYTDATLTTGQGTSSASAKATLAFAELGLLLDWFPDPAGGWHVGGSAGLGMTSVLNQADDSTMAGTGFAGGLFGGYDWALSPTWSMGLALYANGTTSTKLKDMSDKDLDGYRLGSISVMLGGSLLHF